MNEILSFFQGRHVGETAWLFGKGPSLDTFLDAGWLAPLLNAPGTVLCAVNETVRDIVTAPYAFAADNCARWQHLYRPDVVLFQPRRILQDTRQSPANPACQVVWVDEDLRADAAQRLAAGPDVLIRRGLAGLPGTVCLALQVLAIMGVREIVCVGVDGGTARARRDWFTLPCPPDCTSYDEIREAFTRAALALKLTVSFWGCDGFVETNRVAEGAA